MSSLTPEQQLALDEQKKSIRFQNEKYFRDHPEVKELVSKFLVKVLNDQPDDVQLAAAKFFTDPQAYAFLNDDYDDSDDGQE